MLVSSAGQERQGKQKTNFSDNHVLLKSGEPNDRREQDLLIGIEVFTRNELQRIVVRIYGSLTSLLVEVRLAKDNFLVDSKLLVAAPRANSNILVDLIPVPSIVFGVVSDGAAVLRLGLGAVLHSSPDEPVRTKRMEIEERDSKRIWVGRSVELVPTVALVGCVVDNSGFGDEVGAIASVSVHSHRDDVGTIRDLVPGESFVARLPNFVLCGERDDSLVREKSA